VELLTHERVVWGTRKDQDKQQVNLLLLTQVQTSDRLALLWDYKKFSPTLLTEFFAHA